MAGRLSKAEKAKPPQHEDIARHWLKVIGDNFDRYHEGFQKCARKQKLTFDEDEFQRTIIDCYNTISRRGLNDTTVQGCLDYWFKAWLMSTRRVSTYDSRKDLNADLNALVEEYRSSQTTVATVRKRHLLNDFTIIRILEEVEKNFEPLTYNCFRLKHLTPLTYKALKELTKVDDCKKRVVTVNKWLKQNFDRTETYNNFIEKYPEFDDVN